MDEYITDMDNPELLAACGFTGNQLSEEDGDLDDSGTFRSNIRNTFFGGFWKGVREQVIERDDHKCKKCLEMVAKEDESIDHIVSVSSWFNKTGYKKTRAERDEWYNDQSNLQLMHCKCNSSKGGEAFDPVRVNFAKSHKLVS